MKKQEKKQIFKEIETLTKVSLNSEQLAIVRKLIAPSTEVFKNSRYSKRTIEAVLQGRRTNGQLLQLAIDAARKELKLCNSVMNEIENLLSSILLQMTKEYRYILEKGSKKYICPNCGKKTFVLSIYVCTCPPNVPR